MKGEERKKALPCVRNKCALAACFPGALSTPRSEGPLRAQKPQVPLRYVEKSPEKGDGPHPHCLARTENISRHVHGANASQHGSACPRWLCQRQKCPVLPRQRGLTFQLPKKQQPNFLKQVRWAEGSTPPFEIHYHSTHRCVRAMGTGPEQQNPSETGREICTACAVIRAEGQLPCEGRL